MAWRNRQTHKLVALKDVKRLTGLDPSEVLLRSDTQQLVRIDDRGRRAEFVRLPLELLPAEPAELTDGG